MRLADLNYSQVRGAEFKVALLPFGATEPHNLHLPYGTDTLEADLIARLACAQANSSGAKVIQLPTIPYGTETNLAGFPLAMNLLPSTLGLVIRDLVRSLELSGIRKCVILNSHGGNDFKPILRELYGQTSVHLFLCDWYRNLTSDIQKELFQEPGDHAGAMETAIILAYHPELVATNEDGSFQADAGQVRPLRFDALRKGWVSITRPWHLLTTNTGSGNPHEATASKGEKLVETAAARLAQFLVELSESPLDSSFPFA